MAGRRWASERATRDEPINAIHEAVDDDAKQDWGDVLVALGVSHADFEDETFVQAFLNGAREVYDEVEDQLDE